MIVSMKPSYDITQKILKLISSISEKMGEVNANYLSKQSPQMRKQNRNKIKQYILRYKYKKSDSHSKPSQSLVKAIDTPT